MMKRERPTHNQTSDRHRKIWRTIENTHTNTTLSLTHTHTERINRERHTWINPTCLGVGVQHDVEPEPEGHDEQAVPDQEHEETVQH